MKKLVCLTLIIALAIPLAFAGGSRNRGASSGTGSQGSAGKIVIYTSIYEDVIEALGKVLGRQFPGYQITFYYGGTGQIQAKVAAEQAANSLGCDMLMVAEPAYSLELKQNGMLHPYISKEASNLAFDYDREGYWYPVRVSNMVLAYNPGRNTKASIPNSFNDFAFNTGVRGAISMSNPLSSGTAMASVIALRDKYGNGYFEALARQDVMIESGSVALSKLESGECKVIMVLEESVLKKRQEERSNLEVIYPTDGTILIPSTIMIINDKWNANKNIKTAEAITDFFLSEDGQNSIVAGWMHSVRKNFSKIPFDSIPTTQIQANSMPVNWENCFHQKDEIYALFEEFLSSRR